MDIIKHIFSEFIQAKLKQYILGHQPINVDQIEFDKNTAIIYDIYFDPDSILSQPICGFKITSIYTNELNICIKNESDNISSIYLDNLSVKIKPISSLSTMNYSTVKTESDISIANIQYLLNNTEFFGKDQEINGCLDQLLNKFLDTTELLINNINFNIDNKLSITINHFTWNKQVIIFNLLSIDDYFVITHGKIEVSNCEKCIDLSKSSFSFNPFDTENIEDSFYDLNLNIHLLEIEIKDMKLNKDLFSKEELEQGSRIGLQFWERHKISYYIKIDQITFKNEQMNTIINHVKTNNLKKLYIDSINVLINFDENKNNPFDINLLNKLKSIKGKINELSIKIANGNDSIVVECEQLIFKLFKWLSIKNFNVIDKVKKSQWNKLICQDLTRTNDDPFAIKIHKRNHGVIDVYMKPLRMFVNQYTVLFLISLKHNYVQLDNNNWPFKLNLINDLSILLDYKPIKFNTGLGSADLINLFPLQNLHLTLHSNLVGSTEEAISVWKNDLNNSGITFKYLKSIMLINSLSTMLSGFGDIFIQPYDHISEQGIGGLLPGINIGIWSFIDKIISGGCDLVTRVTISASSVLDTSQHYIYPSAINLAKESKFSNQPSSLSSGFSEAYNTLINELQDTGNIVILPFDGQHTFGNGLLAFGQSVPILILKPVSASLFSFSKIILGLKNGVSENQKMIMDQKYN